MTQETMPLHKLRQLADPTIDWPWVSIPPRKPLTLKLATIRTPRPQPLTTDEQLGISPHPHLDRIAYLALNGWDDPIIIDTNLDVWPIEDGNHRLYAAIIRADTHIAVVHLAGQEDDLP